MLAVDRLEHVFPVRKEGRKEGRRQTEIGRRYFIGEDSLASNKGGAFLL